MSLTHPELLLLLLLLPLAAGRRAPGLAAGLRVLRGLLAALVVLCLAGPYLAEGEPGVDLIVVADRSASVGRAGRERTAELLGLLDRARGRHDRLGLVGFGQVARVERPLSGERQGALAWEDQAHGSRLAEGLALAAQLARPARRTRLLVLSDGLYTGLDPLADASLARLSRLPVWTRHVGAPPAADVSAAELDLPGTVEPRSAFLVEFALRGPPGATARYRLERNGLLLAEGEVELADGRRRLFVRDLVDEPGTARYRLTVSGEADSRPANNVSEALLRVEAPPRILLGTAAGSSGGLLAASLRGAGMEVDVRAPEELGWTAAELSPYRVTLLENLPLERLGTTQTKALAAAVEKGVTALLVTGGPGAFGAGGYHRSALDPLLPVSMEVRQEERRNVLALAVVLDRSGSMGMPSAGGRPKMELANLAAAESIRLLSPQDEVAVIAVDSAPRSIVPLARADAPAALVRAVLRIEPSGGGIFVRAGLDAAVKELRASRLPTRHILLFADASDAEDQTGCIPLARELRQEGISISVVGLGLPSDSDGQFLRDLAGVGGGEAYFTNSAADLPRVFSQEVIRITRRGFLQQPTPVASLPQLHELGLSPAAEAPPVGGYNLTRARPGAAVALRTEDDYRAPVVAFRRRGRARVAALLAEVDGPASGPFGRWEKLPALLVGLVRHLGAGVDAGAGKLYARNDRGSARLRLEMPPELAGRLRTRQLAVELLPPDGSAPLRVQLEWEAGDTATGRAALTKPGHYLPVVDLGGDGLLRGPPVSVPYSPEFLPVDEEEGRALLRGLAAATDGRTLAVAGEAFRRAGTVAPGGRLDLRPWLALAALLVLLVEVAERRLGLLGWLRGALGRPRV